MKNQLLIYFLVIFSFFSCNNKLDELKEINSFLQSNYEFNFRVLNRNRGRYYQKVEEQPYWKVDKINQLDSDFDILIANIDKAISNKESNLTVITSDYQSIISDVTEIVNYRKDYLQTEFDNIEKIKTDSNEFYLNCVKNRLVIAVSYAFDYIIDRATSDFCGTHNVNVNSNFTKSNEDKFRLTLTSNQGQTMRENRRIMINQIEFNGKEKKVGYKIKDNFSFSDIEFDSLQKGNYRIRGVLRFYEHGKKYDVPFNEKFDVK